MQSKDIRRSIRAALKNPTLSTAHTGPEIQEAIQVGHEHDGDAVFIATIQDHNVLCALVVGRSLLYGDEALEYMVEYHDGDDQRAVAWLEQMANDAADDLSEDGQTFFGLIRAEGDDRWRGFRGQKPMTVDEVRNKARSAKN